MQTMRVCVAAICLAACSVPSLAFAQWGGNFGGYYGWGNGYPYGAGINGGAFGYTPPPPYFAVHPPVYYSSQITRRPYGASPYAMPAISQTGVMYAPAEPAYAAPAPQMIINPFVAGAAQWSPPATTGSVENLPAGKTAPPTAEEVKPAATLPVPPPAGN